MRSMLSCVRTRPSAPASHDEGFDRVLTADPVRIVAEPFAAAPAAARRQRDDPVGMRFGLHISEFPWAPDELRRAVASVAVRAEAAGFDAIWVMDHFRQIPQIGRAWDAMPESWTTLAYLAGVTERIELGTLVTGVAYRNVAHLAKIVATVDVLSGGRARCGLGLGWFEQEHRAYGWDFPLYVAPVRHARGRTCAPADDVGPGQPAVRRHCDLRCPRRCATRGRCRTGYRSWSAVTANGALSRWRPGTRTGAM